jgi:hypothetical protein
MAKLTLSVDDEVVERAKAYAQRQRTSVSRLVERFLDLLARPRRPRDEPPVLARLRGTLKGARVDRRDYRRHVEQKYR